MAIVESDHLPIETIVKKPLSKKQKRLQIMKLMMLQYDTEIRYEQGEKMHTTDFLSRVVYKEERDKDQDGHSQINAISYFRIGKEKLRRETNNNEIFSTLNRMIVDVLPEKRSELPVQLSHFFTFRNELPSHDGLNFKGEQVI